MIRVGLLVALWLASSTGVGRAMQVTWTISGTASTVSGPLDYFPNDSPYVLTITFETETAPTPIVPGLQTDYDGAIVAASFESATYSPEIDLTAPGASRIIAGLYSTSFLMGSETPSPEHPYLSLSYSNGLGLPPASGVVPLPTTPPQSNVWVVRLQLIAYQDPYFVLHSNIDTANIDYSVPEPAMGWAGALLVALARRLRHQPPKSPASR